MTGQPFTLLVDIPLKPGRADEFMALLNDVFEAMKVEETFVSATALRGTEDPDTILLCENWIDRENFMSVQLKRPYRHRYEARLPELLRSPRKLSFFEPIRPRPIAVFGERRIPPTISNGKSACRKSSIASDCVLGSRHRDVAAGDCQFGWLQGVRNLLRQTSFWLQRPATIRIV